MSVSGPAIGAQPPAVDVASGSLESFRRTGVLDAVDVHLACAVARLGGETDPRVLLGVALACRAPRHGHVCVDLEHVAETVAIEGQDPEDIAALEWPEPSAWRAALAGSAVVAPTDAPDDDPRPVVLAGSRLYLERMWRDEKFVADELRRRAGLPTHDLSVPLGSALDEAFPPVEPGAAPDLQRQAALAMLRRALTVVAGGPGTGKTRVIAKTLGLLRRLPGDDVRVALAAPTGKAAARMAEAMRDERWTGGGPQELFPELEPTTTLHRLLGLGPRRRTPQVRDADVIVVDEVSMVSLPLMAHLLRAMPDDCRLVLVGDPGQLASVEAGTVLADIVGDQGLSTDDAGGSDRNERPSVGVDRPSTGRHPPGTGGGDGSGPRRGPLAAAITRLERPYRFDERSDLRPLSDAIRAGDRDAVQRLLGGGRGIRFVEHDDPLGTTDAAGLRDELVANGAALFTAASAGDADRALRLTRELRLLCAHRRGPFGVEGWNAAVERWLTDDVTGFDPTDRWYVGRPVLITRNDRVTGLNNGDSGVVVGTADERAVVVERQEGIAHFRPVQLADVETMHAMTIHKSQGSEFRRVVVVLPPAGSRLATRELLYTAVTRARAELTVVGTWDAVDAALERRVARASGLAAALWSGDETG